MKLFQTLFTICLFVLCSLCQEAIAQKIDASGPVDRVEYEVNGDELIFTVHFREVSAGNQAVDPKNFTVTQFNLIAENSSSPLDQDVIMGQNPMQQTYRVRVAESPAGYRGPIRLRQDWKSVSVQITYQYSLDGVEGTSTGKSPFFVIKRTLLPPVARQVNLGEPKWYTNGSITVPVVTVDDDLRVKIEMKKKRNSRGFGNWYVSYGRIETYFH